MSVHTINDHALEKAKDLLDYPLPKLFSFDVVSFL